MMHDGAAILIEPGHPAESLDVDLESLAAELRNAIPGEDFRVVPKEHVRRGLTWLEVIRIYIPTDAITMGIVEGIVAAIMVEAIRWCRERFKKVPKRGKYVAIYGPDGKVIKSIVLNDPSMEPEDRTTQDLQLPPRLPPPSK